jgi:hypothetical protein
MVVIKAMLPHYETMTIGRYPGPMARHDESTERRSGFFTDADFAPDDSWPDAPEPSWAAESADDGYNGFDGHRDPMTDTSTIPAFDLGPQTESVIVDLTSPLPTVSVDPEPVADPQTDSVPRAMQHRPRRTSRSPSRSRSRTGTSRRSRRATAPTAPSP